MNCSIPDVSRIIACLMECHEQCIEPQEARLRVRSVQGTVPVELLWEQEIFDGSFHYNALMRLPDGSSISVSYSPPSSLPWPMRGVHRHSEADLLRINNTVLRFEDAVALLDVAWKETRLAVRLVNACLLRDYLNRHPMDLSKEEMQTAMDAYRRGQGLYSADDTLLWMLHEGLTQDHLEHLVRELALVDKLRDEVTAGKIDAHFECYRDRYDTLKIACLRCASQAQAAVAFSQISSGERTLPEAAVQMFVDEDSDAQGHSGVDLNRGYRGDLPTALAEAARSAVAGDLLGPLDVDDYWILVSVISIEPAQLNAMTHAAIRRTLFEEWLAQARRDVKIQWYWGETRHTDRYG